MNFKKIIFKILLFFLFQTTNVYSNDIVYIDLDQLFSDSTKGKKIISKLNDINKKNQEQLKIKENEIIILKEELDKQKNILNQEELNKKILNINNIAKEFSDLRQNIIRNYEKIKNDELKMFFNDISPLLQEYMSNKSIKIIFDKKNIFLANNDYDVTSEILKIIEKSF